MTLNMSQSFATTFISGLVVSTAFIGNDHTPTVAPHSNVSLSVYGSSGVRFNSFATCLTAGLTMVLEPSKVGLAIRGRRWSFDVSGNELFLTVFDGV